MKFLLELVVPCFGSQQLHQSAASVDDHFSGETQSLTKQRRRRKRVRVAGQPGQEWRPSLSVISEHKPALTEKSEEKRKVRRKSEVSGGDASSRPGGGHVRFRSDGFGSNDFEPIEERVMEPIVLVCGKWKLEKTMWLFEVDNEQGSILIVANENTRFEDFVEIIFEDYGVDFAEYDLDI